MNIEQARFNMIEQQIRPGRFWIRRFSTCLFVVKREDFVPAAYSNLAFADMEIPIGSGQVMLAPRVEAKLLQELGIKKTDKVLEIGTGSGYMAALLAARAEHVFTVELRPELADFAKENLKRAGVTNVTVEVGNGAKGWSQRGPYDAIVVSGCRPRRARSRTQATARRRPLAVVVGEAPVMEAQLITCTADGIYNTVNLFETVIPALTASAPNLDSPSDATHSRTTTRRMAGRRQPPKPVLLDVREPWEIEMCSCRLALHIPMHLVPMRCEEFDPDDEIVVFAITADAACR
jgi:protein-L-isoaspartate(D-aspartate) O-methyltransferase